MNRRFMRLIGFALLTLLLLGLSAAPIVAQNSPIEFQFVGWGGPEEHDVFQHLVDTFNTDNPDIVIHYQQIPNDYVTALKTMVAGGTAPDIAYIPDGDFSAFVTKGQLVDIQSM